MKQEIEFRDWLRRTYGVQDYEAFQNTQTEEIAIRYSEHVTKQLQQGCVVRPEVGGAKEGEQLGNANEKGVSVGFCNHQYEFNSDGYQSCMWCGKSISG